MNSSPTRNAVLVLSILRSMHHSLFTIVQLPRGGKLEWDEGAQKITMVFSPTKKIVLNTDLKIENVLGMNNLMALKGRKLNGFRDYGTSGTFIFETN